MSLTESFAAGVGDAYHLDQRILTALEPRLAVVLEEARATWPGVDISGKRFAKHLAEVAPDVDDVAAALGEMHTSDLYLACGCADANEAALRAFDQKVLPGAKKAIARIDASASFVDEVYADVRIRLLFAERGKPRIAAYLGRGPLVHWVQVSATRAAQTKKRRDHKRSRDVGISQLALMAVEDDAELAPLASQIEEPFERAFRDALAELTPRERNVLRLYLLEEVSAEAIGVMYRVHRATVARWIAQARRKVHAGTRKRMASEVKLGPTSFESIMGQVLNGLDISIASLLSET